MEKIIKPFGFRDQLGYFFGDYANGLFFTLTASYLTLFYVDILGVSVASVGLLLAVARVWDAINDPIIGSWIDNQKATPEGKFRPWIMRMAIPVVLFGMLSFSAFPILIQAPLYVKLIYAYVTYIAFGMSYTAINIPYGSLASVITDNEAERSTLSMARSYGAMAAGLTLNFLIPLLVFDSNNVPKASGFIMVVIVVGILAIIFYTLCNKFSVERIVSPYREGQKKDFMNTLKGITKNRPLIVQMLVGMLSIGMFLTSSTLAPYLFKDYFRDARALSWMGLISIFCVVIVSPLIKPLVTKFGKKEVSVGGLILYTACWMIFYIFPITNIYVYFGIMVVATCGLSLMTLLTWAFIPDAIDYQEYISGVREEGTIYAIYSFSRKLGQAFSGFIGAYVLIWVGYVAGQPEQSPETILKIKQYASLVPVCIGCVLALTLGFGYNLDKKNLSMVTEELRQRREKMKN